MAECERELEHNLIRSTVRPKVLARPPLQRAIVVLACPLSQSGKCPSSKGKWVCETCRATIEYNLENLEIYCACGSFPVAACTFCCCSEKHGEEFVSDQKLQEKLIALKPVETVNILVLGVTGVGKSTWINSIANYMTYSTFSQAMSAGKLLHQIPAYFKMMDESDVIREIKVGEEDKTKEVFSVKNESATQMPSSYVIRYGDINVRLLDTPGVGDCRGLSKDCENLSYVLSYLENWEWLHGICILLKPDENRLTGHFKYCISELLRHLHRSATDNIVFCFTNGRKTNYKILDTENCLVQAIEECTKERGITIKMDKSTMFVLENESFRYLAAHYQGVNFSARQIRKCEKSWYFSKKECERLINYLKTKTPHQLISTISLNAARRVISWIIKPMVEICNELETNKVLLETKENEIEEGRVDSFARIPVQQVRLVTKELDTPVLVCTDSRCAEYIFNPETKTTVAHYKLPCEEKPRIKEFGRRILLLVPFYAFIDKLVSSNKCSKCQHDKSVHITITCMTKLEGFQEVIDMDDLKKKIVDLGDAIRVINETNDKFCQFLKIHSLVGCDDAYADEIDKATETENLAPANSEEEKNLKKERLNKLKFLKEEYEYTKLFISKQTDGSKCISPERVFELRNRLYEIPLVAEHLKNAERITERAIANMIRNEENIC